MQNEIKPTQERDIIKFDSGKIWIVLLVVIFIVLIAAGVFYYFAYYKQNNKLIKMNQQTQTTQIQTKTSLDPQKEATHLSKVADNPDTYFMRGFDMTWDQIEPKKGQFDWQETDEMLAKMPGEIYYLSIIQPFANWDQDTCHPENKYQTSVDPKKAAKGLKVGKPCDMQAYAEFLTKAVERYDGDGIDDAPGIITPIKYWEILNEPSMQGGQTGGMGEELKFFVGSPDDYFQILKTSYETIKKADPEAKVLHAGMAGMQSDAVEFFAPIFTPEGGKYFDIANNHTISTNEQREDLSMIKFKKLLADNGLGDKPVWITEVQYGQLTEKPQDLREMEVLMAKSTVFALAKGAEKLFYISNWLQWGGKEKWDDPENMKKNLDGSTQKVYLNLVDKVNNFDKVETIKEEYRENPMEMDGATSVIGQYRFTSGAKNIYVLWGEAELPSEISGKVKVTDIYGKSTQIDAKNIKLTNEPIFVEEL